MWFLQVAQSQLDKLPPDVVDSLPANIVQQLRDGVIDKIPDSVVNKLPVSIQDKIPAGLLEAAAANPGFTKVLLGIGILAVLGFVWGVFRRAVKISVYSGIAAAVAWYFFFQQ